MKIAIGILGLIIIIGLPLVIIDASSTPKPAQGQCPLVKRTVLPDICVNSCRQAFDCTVTTRPYAVFFSQAASCSDAIICE